MKLRFNGAAAFGLRKCSLGNGNLRFLFPLQWGRNLAAAEVDLPQPVVGVHCLASMGPQPCGCGSAQDPDGWPGQQTASMGPQPCGCGSLVLATHQREALHAASMGPQPCGCGSIVPFRRVNLENYASMGPQPCGCGSRWAFDSARDAVGASMGPQPCGCGSIPTMPAWRASQRSFNGAATLRLRK